MNESTEQGKSELPKETRDLILAAESGDLNAQFRLGVHYRNGDAGLPQDLSLTHHWIIMAARSGHIHAQNMEGCLLIKEGGWGGPKPPSESDEWKALYWFREAAQQGHQAAGLRYEDLLRKKAAINLVYQSLEDEIQNYEWGQEFLDPPPKTIHDPLLREIYAEVDAVVNASPGGCPYLRLVSGNWSGETAVFSLASHKILGILCPSCGEWLRWREELRHVWSHREIDKHPVEIQFWLPRFRCETHGVIPSPLPIRLVDSRGQWKPIP